MRGLSINTSGSGNMASPEPSPSTPHPSGAPDLSAVNSFLLTMKDRGSSVFEDTIPVTPAPPSRKKLSDISSSSDVVEAASPASPPAAASKGADDAEEQDSKKPDSPSLTISPVPGKAITFDDAPTEPPMTPVAVLLASKEGEVHIKENGALFGHPWRPRYLRLQNRQLFIFPNRDAIKPKHVLRLVGSFATATVNKKHPHSFTLKTAKKDVFRLFASSDAERHDWIETINRASTGFDPRMMTLKNLKREGLLSPGGAERQERENAAMVAQLALLCGDGSDEDAHKASEALEEAERLKREAAEAEAAKKQQKRHHKKHHHSKTSPSTKKKKDKKKAKKESREAGARRMSAPAVMGAFSDSESDGESSEDDEISVNRARARRRQQRKSSISRRYA